jgi:RNA polymerase primary sigma factor
VHVVDRLAHIRRAEGRLREAFGRDATDEELAHELDLDARRVRQYRDASRPPISLDAPLGDEADTAISEVVADPNATAPFAALVQHTDTDLMRRVMVDLSERESAILGLRFGLDDGRERTLEEIGQRFGVTRERIRQIQEEALKKLRRQMEKRDCPEVDPDTIAVAA